MRRAPRDFYYRARMVQLPRVVRKRCDACGRLIRPIPGGRYALAISARLTPRGMGGRWFHLACWDGRESWETQLRAARTMEV